MASSGNATSINFLGKMKRWLTVIVIPLALRLDRSGIMMASSLGSQSHRRIDAGLSLTIRMAGFRINDADTAATLNKSCTTHLPAGIGSRPWYDGEFRESGGEELLGFGGRQEGLASAASREGRRAW